MKYVYTKNRILYMTSSGYELQRLLYRIAATGFVCDLYYINIGHDNRYWHWCVYQYKIYIYLILSHLFIFAEKYVTMSSVALYG